MTGYPYFFLVHSIFGNVLLSLGIFPGGMAKTILGRIDFRGLERQFE
jgi:hypothetical protein